jgi:hypothetical protein
MYTNTPPFSDGPIGGAGYSPGSTNEFVSILTRPIGSLA